MSVSISQKKSRNNKKIWYYLEWGKEQGQRTAIAIFTYVKPLDQLQKNHNKESLAILEMKKSQMILDQQAIASGYIPKHKYKNNFLDFYADFVKNNQRVDTTDIKNSLAISCKYFD
jgi:hypothetical protein